MGVTVCAFRRENQVYIVTFSARAKIKDYSFSWVVPDSAGTYVVEVGLVPTQLTAYDAVWLEVG